MGQEQHRYATPVRVEKGCTTDHVRNIQATACPITPAVDAVPGVHVDALIQQRQHGAVLVRHRSPHQRRVPAETARMTSARACEICRVASYHLRCRSQW